jgi:hypothetical protein
MTDTETKDFRLICFRLNVIILAPTPMKELTNPEENSSIQTGQAEEGILHQILIQLKFNP